MIPEKKVDLLQSLTDETVQHFTMMQYFQPEYIPERHHPDQQLMFVVDINCPNIRTYLQKVSEIHKIKPLII